MSETPGKIEMLDISELFLSLQGEGPFSGRPAVFLRLSGCIAPLCPWCDTMYACKPGRKVSLPDICDEILSFETELVVITGGEPFLQWDAGVKRLEKILLEKGCRVQYETGGKILIPADARGTCVCSPKYIHGDWCFVTENIHRAQLFKFVVSRDYQVVEDFVKTHGIPARKVWIMPLGTHREEQLTLMPALWEFCVKNRFNFSPRLHILAFDNQRGI